MNMTDAHEALAWRKSSFSGSGNNCVEVGFGRAFVAMRDSKKPDAAGLRFRATEWSAFVSGIRAGDLG